MKQIEMKFARVVYTDFGVETRFKTDGAAISAWPHDTHHYHVIAHRLGYGDDILAYCREHEVAHSLVCECLFDRESYVLSHLARGIDIDEPRAVMEEIAAQSLQRWIRAHERPIIGGVNWDDLKRYALNVLP